jgi:DNA-binding PadR family transcriptional regulator
MFADNTLTPKEAVRLCALGTIAEKAMRYSELAGSVRAFVGRMMGPSLDLMGTSIELLKYEGLVAAVDGRGMEDDATLALTEAGRRELAALLVARLRPGNDLSKLIVALKLRFLHLLEAPARRGQAELLTDAAETELARLQDLRGREAEGGQGEGRYFLSWLDLEIEQLTARIAWLGDFQGRI